jgi:hypothetical protein
LILDGPQVGGSKVRAARAHDGAFAFIYTPRGAPLTVRLDVIGSERVTATWFDPRYGIATPIHTGDNRGIQTFTPPTVGRGSDWVLVVDDARKGFPPPGHPG